MNFRSVAQLSDQLLQWTRELPQDIDVVVGVPRSGLLAANLLSLYLNVRLTDVEGLLQGRCYEWGTRRFKPGADEGSGSEFLARPRKVLVLDDSLLSGASLRAVRERVAEAGLPHDVRYAAVYVAPDRRDEVDYYCELLNAPRVFEWNVLNGALVDRLCVSLEQVLCAPAPIGIGHEAFARFMDGARPWVVPPQEIGWVLCSRPERSRRVVENWLRHHRIQYRRLVMAGSAAMDARRPSALAAWKAHVYRGSDAVLYVDGSYWGAVEIARLSGRHVLCSETMQLVHPGTMPLRRSDPPLELHPARRKGALEAAGGAAKALIRLVLPDAAVAAIRRWRAGAAARPTEQSATGIAFIAPETGPTIAGIAPKRAVNAGAGAPVSPPSLQPPRLRSHRGRE